VRGAVSSQPPPAQGDAPLTLAARVGNLKEVMQLLQSNADPNLGDAVGETPLFESCANGNADISAALLVHGADPMIKSLTGISAGDITMDGTTKGLLAFFGGDELSN